MSSKTYCPTCASHTSNLNRALTTGRFCYMCGLSKDPVPEITTVQRARQDDDLSDRFAELCVENDRLKRELDNTKLLLNRLRDVVKGLG